MAVACFFFRRKGARITWTTWTKESEVAKEIRSSCRRTYTKDFVPATDIVDYTYYVGGAALERSKYVVYGHCVSLAFPGWSPRVTILINPGICKVDQLILETHVSLGLHIILAPLQKKFNATPFVFFRWWWSKITIIYENGQHVWPSNLFR